MNTLPIKKRPWLLLIPLLIVAIVIIASVSRDDDTGQTAGNTRAVNSREGLPAPKPSADSSLTNNRPDFMAGFPDDVFLIDGTVTAYEKPIGDTGHVVTIQSFALRQAAQSQYEQALAIDGWLASVEEGDLNNTIVRGEKDGRTVRVDISDSEPGVFVAIEASAGS